MPRCITGLIFRLPPVRVAAHRCARKSVSPRSGRPRCVPRRRSSWVSLSMYLDLKCTLSLSIPQCAQSTPTASGSRSSARRWTVERLRFGQLPMLVRVVVGLSLLHAWVSFEEFVVDRSGLWKYMPDYKVGRVCVWDLTVIALIIAGLVWASVGGRRSESPEAARSSR